MTTKAKRPAPKSSEWTIQREELDRLVKTFKGTLNDVLVTPVMAAYILEKYNSGNRKLRTGHANFFVNTLQRKGWENTGEPIIFAKEGILNNGQHRLEGIVRSDTPAIMDIRFGIPRKAFAITDTGAKRIAGDVLSITGSTSPFAAAAAIRLLLAYELGLPTNYVARVGNDQILAGFHRWPDIEGAIDLNHKYIGRKGFLNASSNAFTYLAIQQTDKKP